MLWRVYQSIIATVHCSAAVASLVVGLWHPEAGGGGSSAFGSVLPYPRLASLGAVLSWIFSSLSARCHS